MVTPSPQKVLQEPGPLPCMSYPPACGFTATTLRQHPPPKCGGILSFCAPPPNLGVSLRRGAQEFSQAKSIPVQPVLSWLKCNLPGARGHPTEAGGAFAILLRYSPHFHPYQPSRPATYWRISGEGGGGEIKPPSHSLPAVGVHFKIALRSYFSSCPPES
uniref:Uncharacterized protein n=1 Tax=Micrurus corallinus TaxID=54390 RepID=A0A2D4FVN9_MICCO